MQSVGLGSLTIDRPVALRSSVQSVGPQVFRAVCRSGSLSIDRPVVLKSPMQPVDQDVLLALRQPAVV